VNKGGYPFRELQNQRPSPACVTPMQSSISLSSSSGPQILSRREYRSCHIYLPDANEHTAAILVNNRYYSFFQFHRDQKRSLELAQKLTQRGYSVVMTEAPKGYGLWTLEPTAQPAQPRSAVNLKGETSQGHSLYKLLSSPSQYRPCHIQVPDLDKRLAAIQHENKFYSLFKAVAEIQEANQLIRRLANRGDGAIVTQTAKGFAIWIEEPEAWMA
jgi:hypothetical protein